MFINPKLTLILLLITLSWFNCNSNHTTIPFSIEEATIDEIHQAFDQNKLTSKQLVTFYLKRINKLNPLLRAVIEVNPDAIYQAEKADRLWRSKAKGTFLGSLHGIPVLLKDNIATKDKLNTTAGSFALLGSVVPRDAGVVAKLRKAGAIILGKASMSEWAAFRSSAAPSGFCGRSGQGKNPYNLSAGPCGSSSGSGISAAANLVTVTLGTETDGSIICPSNANSLVGIKPTVGLASRAGVVPLSPRQDTVGPMCRTVSDAVYVLNAIAGFDENDKATKSAVRYIPHDGYKQFLKPNGLKGKRLGIVRNPFFKFIGNENTAAAYERHIQTLRKKGAVVIDNVEIATVNTINSENSGETFAMAVEFKAALNDYLKELVSSPVRSLADVIAFNKRHSKMERLKKYGQDQLEYAESLKGVDATYQATLSNLRKLSINGIEKTMKENKLDAIVTPGSDVSAVLAIGGYPGIVVPAGYDNDGVPFGICFGGLKGSEPILIEIAYGFEQATKIRKPPSFKR